MLANRPFDVIMMSFFITKNNTNIYPFSFFQVSLIVPKFKPTMTGAKKEGLLWVIELLHVKMLVIEVSCMAKFEIGFLTTKIARLQWIVSRIQLNPSSKENFGYTKKEECKCTEYVITPT